MPNSLVDSWTFRSPRGIILLPVRLTGHKAMRGVTLVRHPHWVRQFLILAKQSRRLYTAELKRLSFS